jgi:hypothetical protein
VIGGDGKALWQQGPSASFVTANVWPSVPSEGRLSLRGFLVVQSISFRYRLTGRFSTVAASFAAAIWASYFATATFAATTSPIEDFSKKQL